MLSIGEAMRVVDLQSVNRSLFWLRVDQVNIIYFYFYFYFLSFHMSWPNAMTSLCVLGKMFTLSKTRITDFIWNFF
jgi:hypothetical protein